MDDVSGVTVAELGHRHVDELHLIVLQDAHGFLNAAERRRQFLAHHDLLLLWDHVVLLDVVHTAEVHRALL